MSLEVAATMLLPDMDSNDTPLRLDRSAACALRRLRAVCAELSTLDLNGPVWAGGSFITRKAELRDVDVVLRLDRVEVHGDIHTALRDFMKEPR